MLSVVALVVVVRFTLKPVGALAAQISQIDASNVSGEGQLGCSVEELDPVVHRLNEFGATRYGVRSGEGVYGGCRPRVRTPLAGLSAALEVCSSRPRDEAAYRQVIRKCLGVTQTMQVMVENLLAVTNRIPDGQLLPLRTVGG